MKIINREYMSGIVSVVNYDSFEENTLKQVIKIVDKVMIKYFQGDEWDKLSASYRVSGKYVEPGVNQDDLHTSDFSKSDSAKFNLFVETGKFSDVITDIEWELNRFIDLKEFDGVQLDFDYCQVVFDSYGDINAYCNHQVFGFSIGNGDDSSLHDIISYNIIKNKSDYLWEELPNYSIREYTDLILITGDFEGAYQLVAEIIHNEKMNTWAVGDTLNKTSQQLADIAIGLTSPQPRDMNYLKEEKEDFLLAVEDIVDDTLGTNYVIGQKGIIDYFNRISPVLLKRILSGEIQIN